jgi:hypothetical protein
MTFIYSRENYVPPNPLLQGEPNVFREAQLKGRARAVVSLTHQTKGQDYSFYNKEGVWGVREAELL